MAVIVAVCMVALTVSAAMVLDFGVVRFDRQTNKLAADDAAAAGLQAADKGTGDVYNSLAVCAAVDYLRVNRSQLSSLPACTPDANQICSTTTPASYQQTVVSGTKTITVTVVSPYNTTDTAGGGSFGEESSMTSLSDDPGASTKQGCDQIGVIIKQSTAPGLGRIVRTSPMVTRVRSVGRVDVSSGDVAPAMLLLERSLCGVLKVGAVGNDSSIIVKGSGTIPATIHSDSTATGAGCGSGSNSQLFLGNSNNAIVAYGSSTGASGTISSVATFNGIASNVVSDGVSRVYGTTQMYGGPAGTPSDVAGRKQVSRRPIDKRYLAGVTTAVRSAYSDWTRSHSNPGGSWQTAGTGHYFGCPTAANMTTMAGYGVNDWVWIDCGSNSGITLDGTIGAGHIFFHGFIKGGRIAMPNATNVFVDNTDDSGARINDSAISLNNNQAFCVRASYAGCDTASPTVGQCNVGPTSGNAKLLVRRGMLNGNGTSSLLRLCNTTAILEGGQLGSGSVTAPGGCLPAPLTTTDPVSTSWGSAPTSTPCPGASTSAGTSQINTNGRVDWTAPNTIGSMAALTDAAKQTLWDGGEDLALWDESYGGSSNPTYSMAGGGNMHVGGVFMAPNAAPFGITGGGTQDLTNAQFIVTKFQLGGGATLIMQVDPNNAVGLPALQNFRLVR